MILNNLFFLTVGLLASTIQAQPPDDMADKPETNPYTQFFLQSIQSNISVSGPDFNNWFLHASPAALGLNYVALVNSVRNATTFTFNGTHVLAFDHPDLVLGLESAADAAAVEAPVQLSIDSGTQFHFDMGLLLRPNDTDFGAFVACNKTVPPFLYYNGVSHSQVVPVTQGCARVDVTAFMMG